MGSRLNEMLDEVKNLYLDEEISAIIIALKDASLSDEGFYNMEAVKKILQSDEEAIKIHKGLKGQVRVNFYNATIDGTPTHYISL